MNESATIIQKLWNSCNVVRGDGLSYQDYIEQDRDGGIAKALQVCDDRSTPELTEVLGG
jgi:hypothetical protein